LTAQFEPKFISAPEALVAAWAYVRGDKATAAALLFPRIEQTPDDRWVFWAVTDLLGNVYHQDMLTAFSDDRDFPRTLALAKHLAQPQFASFQYQDRARRLAEQLVGRGEDFKTFVLPDAKQWVALQQTLSRPEQISYLAKRLRLLNCFQVGQPGDVSYESPQFAEPQGESRRYRRKAADDKQGKQPHEVINPYVELHRMKLMVGDLEILAPMLLDEDYAPTYSYWRDFHPSRTLHQVNWMIADIMNTVAKRNLSQLRDLSEMDEAAKRKQVDSVIAWCRAHADESQEQLQLETLKTAKSWPEVAAAAHELSASHNRQALPLFVAKFDQFSDGQDDIAKFCFDLDDPHAAVPAREWVKSSKEPVRFWSAMILLKHGDRKSDEGLATLKGVLAHDDGSYWFPQAIEQLLELKSEESAALAAEILKKPRFELSDYNAGAILQRLLLAGRQEALDYLLAKLKSGDKSGSASGDWNGQHVERELTGGDRAAAIVADLRTDSTPFHSLAPDDQRTKERNEMAGWLQEQFALIKAGKPSQIKTEPKPLVHATWQLDAP
jgi:hypothetical protein